MWDEIKETLGAACWIFLVLLIIIVGIALAGGLIVLAGYLGGLIHTSVAVIMVLVTALFELAVIIALGARGR